MGPPERTNIIPALPIFIPIPLLEAVVAEILFVALWTANSSGAKPRDVDCFLTKGTYLVVLLDVVLG